MPKKRKNTKYLISTKSNQSKLSYEYLLEDGSLSSLKQYKKTTTDFLKYHWEYYCELAYQRKSFEEPITKVLNQIALANYSFKNWQRTVKLRYSLHPLCAVGSLKSIGGRFNIGEISTQFVQFPALYIASDKKTSLSEVLGRIGPENSKMSSVDLALMNPSSETTVSVSGVLEKVLDLRDHKNLKPLVDILKNFKISKHLEKTAKKLKTQLPGVIKTTELLHQRLLDPNWRVWPMRLDIPANSQIFGELVYNARIEAILYHSVLTKKESIAIFPDNFISTSSYIEIDDVMPDSRVPNRIDSKNYQICRLTVNDLQNRK